MGCGDFEVRSRLSLNNLPGWIIYFLGEIAALASSVLGVFVRQSFRCQAQTNYDNKSSPTEARIYCFNVTKKAVHLGLEHRIAPMLY